MLDAKNFKFYIKTHDDCESIPEGQVSVGFKYTYNGKLYGRVYKLENPTLSDICEGLELIFNQQMEYHTAYVENEEKSDESTTE